MLPGEHPDVDTPIQEDTELTTSVQVSGLDVNTDMVFFVETDCDPNGTSTWIEAPFIIESVGSICENPIEITSLLLCFEMVVVVAVTVLSQSMCHHIKIHLYDSHSYI